MATGHIIRPGRPWVSKTYALRAVLPVCTVILNKKDDKVAADYSNFMTK